MTNEIMAASPALTGFSAAQVMDLWINAGAPVSLVAIGWLITMILMPAAGAVVFVQGLVARRRGREPWWHPRMLILAGLITVTTTLIAALTTLHDQFYYTATQTWGAAQQAMLSMNIAHACTVLRVGILAAAFCFGLAVILPTRRKEPPTTGGTVR